MQWAVTFSRLTLVRLVGTTLVGLALGVAIALQFRAPAPGRASVLPTSPLTAAECVTGRCTAAGATAQDLTTVRTALGPAYAVSGLRISDPHGVLREIEIVASDGERTMTIHAARAASVPKEWRAERQTNPMPAQPAELLIIRSVLVSPRDRAKWAVEIQAASPRSAPDLGAAAHRLAAQPDLVR